MLKPFDTATKVMSSDKDVTISMVRPIVKEIIKDNLEPKDGDSVFTKNFKKTVKSDLSTRFLKKTDPKHEEVSCTLLSEILGE